MTSHTESVLLCKNKILSPFATRSQDLCLVPKIEGIPATDSIARPLVPDIDKCSVDKLLLCVLSSFTVRTRVEEEQAYWDPLDHEDNHAPPEGAWLCDSDYTTRKCRKRQQL